MKKALLLSGLFFMSLVSAQDLAYKIPKEASAVVSAKGGEFQKYVTLEEFNRTKVGENLLGDLFKDNKDEQDIRNTGIDFSANVYYYNHLTDSTSYHCFWFPLSDAGKLEEMLKQRYTSKISQSGNIRKLSKDKSLFLWDDKKFFVVSGELNNRFFEDSIKSALYGVKNINYYDYDYAVAVDTLAYSKDGVVEAVAVEPKEVKEAVTAADNTVYDSVSPPPVDEEYDFNSEDDSDEETVSSDDSGCERSWYSEERVRDCKEQKKRKKELLEKWMEEYAYKNFYKSTGSPSVLDNPLYQRAQDKDAAVTYFIDMSKYLSYSVWDMARYSPIYAFSYYSYPYYWFFQNLTVYGTKNVNGKLFINKDNIRLANEAEVDSRDMEVYKGMYSHKLNKKFLNYINQDKVYGFFGISIDMEKYLQMYPKWMSYYFLGTSHSEEADLLAEFGSILLDEKAVAKVIKGDALLLFNGVSSRESTYKTYEYNDDDYTSKQVEKTKKETLPEFLFMGSSDDYHFIEAVLKYGVKKGKVVFKDGIYTTKDSDLPTDVSVLFKDGIVFAGTSYDEVHQIQTNTYVSKLDKKQKDFLSKNNMTAFFDPGKLVNQVPKEGFEDIQNYMKIRNLLNDMGAVYSKSTGIKGNYLTGEILMEAKEEDENGLKYFLKITEMLSDF